jgi:putative membrane-bound dehydrogenase-like protein
MRTLWLVAASALLTTLTLDVAAQDTAPKPASQEIEDFIKKFPGRGAVGDFSTKPKTPEESLAAFKVPGDLKIELVAAEPDVRQPVFLNFDERGRMWVVQYLQYPFPAGVKVVRYDEHLRAIFDKVPPPPPHHDKGRDKIAIHEDRDGDGRFEHVKTFVDGLNICTALEHDKEGIWVLNPPYLLFYPDRNKDDVPDGDPIVHLEGFGIEDTHAVANSLRWGPDGWLYGCQGSTCHATVKRPGLDKVGVHFKGQAVWRYEPKSKRFEIFAEGGGNAFGLEFDSHGNLFSGHNGGDTRGFHYIQGGYYQKSWGKHGELTNPYAFGFFPQMKGDQAERFSHTFVVYEGGVLPQRYRGQILAPVPLHNYVVLSQLLPDGATFKTHDLDRVVTTTDTWFRPVEIKAGPDGGVYLADWYDTRLTHVDPRDTWDRSNGRIYRLTVKDAPRIEKFDMREWTSERLVDTLSHSNKWFRQTALRLIRERQDASVKPRLLEHLTAADAPSTRAAPSSVEYLWAFASLQKLDEPLIEQFVKHPNADVRACTVRLVGDDHRDSPAILKLAESETDPTVRSQLLCSFKRMPETGVAGALSVLKQPSPLGAHDFRQIAWWAIEAHFPASHDEIFAALSTREAFSDRELSFLVERFAKRLMLDPTEANQALLASLIVKAPSSEAEKQVVSVINSALAGQRNVKVTAALADALLKASPADLDSIESLLLRLRLGDQKSIELAQQFAGDAQRQKPPQRIRIIEALSEIGETSSIRPLTELATTDTDAPIRVAAIQALARFADPQLAQTLITAYVNSAQDLRLRAVAIDVLASRLVWARELVAKVEEETIRRTDVSPEILQRLDLYGDAELSAKIKRIWGNTRATGEELAAEMTRVGKVIRGGLGDKAAGKKLFTQSCAKCHKLFGEGKEIGPDLTGYERSNLDFLLLSIVDPGAAIREEYTTFRVATIDGLVLTGFIKERGQDTITMVTADQGATVIAKSDIEEGPVAIKTSLMPEKQLASLDEKQVRDLFAYLQSLSPIP